MQAGLGASLVRTEELSSEAAKANIAALADLLQDAVDSGASVGFLPPLGVLEARDYWCEVTAALDGGNRILSRHSWMQKSWARSNWISRQDRMRCIVRR
jgi:hypothetical protein